MRVQTHRDIERAAYTVEVRIPETAIRNTYSRMSSGYNFDMLHILQNNKESVSTVLQNLILALKDSKMPLPENVETLIEDANKLLPTWRGVEHTKEVTLQSIKASRKDKGKRKVKLRHKTPSKGSDPSEPYEGL